jgi:hypothetical protein
MLNCPHCGQSMEHPNTVSSRRLRLARRERGECMQCGIKLPDRKHVRCASCREKENIRQALRRD